MARAWSYECCNPYDGLLIFFADSRNQAKTIAYNYDSSYTEYKDIQVHKFSALDHLHYKSGYIMDWDREDDRIELMKAGVVCSKGEESPRESCKYCARVENCKEYSLYINGDNPTELE